jgi:hypothetical protein
VSRKSMGLRSAAAQRRPRSRSTVRKLNLQMTPIVARVLEEVQLPTNAENDSPHIYGWADSSEFQDLDLRCDIRLLVFRVSYLQA